jgi:hypothetical protein
MESKSVSEEAVEAWRLDMLASLFSEYDLTFLLWISVAYFLLYFWITHMLLEGENCHGDKENKDRIIVFIYKYRLI